MILIHVEGTVPVTLCLLTLLSS